MILRLLLLLTAPAWAPPVLLWKLGRICGDGLLFVREGYGAAPVEVPWALRPLFYAFALVAFPVVITAETLLSFLAYLGGLAQRFLIRIARLGRGEPPPLRTSVSPLRLLLGLPVLLSAAVWAPISALLWLLHRLFWRHLVAGTADWLRSDLADFLAGGFRSPRRGGRFETFVALRYMRGRKAAAGVSVVTGLTIGGVGLGVWTLIVVLSVMAGFETDLQDKILGANSHIVVLSYNQKIDDWRGAVDKVREVDGITGVTPFVYTEFILRSKHTVTGAIFKGIDPDTVGEVTDLVDNLVLGPQGRIEHRSEAEALLASLDEPLPPSSLFIDEEERTPPGKLPGIIIGREMAASLRVTVGDTVQAVSPTGEPGPLGGMQAKMAPYVVAGTFHSGMYEYDTKFAYATLGTTQEFLRLGEAVTGLEVKVDDIYQAPDIAKQIGMKLQYPFWTRDWQEMNEALFAALRLEKVVMGIILTFIVGVAALNIISTLIMLVVEKGREIAIMKAMGAGRGALMQLFVVDGLIVGFIGTVIGVTLGLLTCAALARWQFIPLESDVYYVDRLPVHVSPGLTAFVAVVAIVISFVATLWPAWQASSVDPVEGLRDG